MRLYVLGWLLMLASCVEAPVQQNPIVKEGLSEVKVNYETEPQIRLGVVLPLSDYRDFQRSISQSIEQSIRLAYKQDKYKRFPFYVLDSYQASVSSMVKTVQDKSLNVLIVYSSDDVWLTSLLEQLPRGVKVINIGSNQVYRQDLFDLYNNFEEQGELLAQVALDNKITTVGLVLPFDPEGRAVTEAFDRYFVANSGKVLFRLPYQPQFANFLESLKSILLDPNMDKIQAWVFIDKPYSDSSYGLLSVAPLLKTRNSGASRGVIFLGNHYFSNSVLFNQKAFEGSVFIDTNLATKASFVSSYKAEYQKTPPLQALLAFDAYYWLLGLQMRYSEPLKDDYWYHSGGFIGKTGRFRFVKGYGVERAYGAYKIINKGYIEINPPFANFN